MDDSYLNIKRLGGKEYQAQGNWFPNPGDHVAIVALDDHTIRIRLEKGDVQENEITYQWPRKSRREAAILCWRHFDHRQRRARVVSEYPCCKGKAIFQPPWLSLATKSRIPLAEARKCPHCEKKWNVTGKVAEARIVGFEWERPQPKASEATQFLT